MERFLSRLKIYIGVPRCLPLPGAFLPFRLFMIFISDDLLHIYRTMMLLSPLSLFEHALGSWLEHVNHPNDSLPFLCFDTLYCRIVVFLFNPTCIFLLCVRCRSPVTVSSCGKPMATIYDTVAFRETSRGNFVRNTKKKVNVT
jgi:hypothetical protein